LTEMMYKFRAPELSAQFITAPLEDCQLRVLVLVVRVPSYEDIRRIVDRGQCRRRNVHWETEGHLELAARGTTTVHRQLSFTTLRIQIIIGRLCPQRMPVSIYPNRTDTAVATEPAEGR
jgi:hypothetical protein